MAERIRVTDSGAWFGSAGRQVDALLSERAAGGWEEPEEPEEPEELERLEELEQPTWVRGQGSNRSPIWPSRLFGFILLDAVNRAAVQGRKWEPRRGKGRR